MKKDLLPNSKSCKKIGILNACCMGMVRLYQRALSPFLPASCRYYPSCSSYAIILLRFDNVFLACFKILIRILACNPFFRGGFAPPYIYMHPKKLDSIVGNKDAYILAKPHKQEQNQTIYFFLKTDSHLLKLQKFYIIPLYF